MRWWQDDRQFRPFVCELCGPFVVLGYALLEEWRGDEGEGDIEMRAKGLGSSATSLASFKLWQLRVFFSFFYYFSSRSSACFLFRTDRISLRYFGVFFLEPEITPRVQPNIYRVDPTGKRIESFPSVEIEVRALLEGCPYHIFSYHSLLLSHSIPTILA